MFKKLKIILLICTIEANAMPQLTIEQATKIIQSIVGNQEMSSTDAKNLLLENGFEEESLFFLNRKEQQWFCRCDCYTSDSETVGAVRFFFPKNYFVHFQVKYISPEGLKGFITNLKQQENNPQEQLIQQQKPIEQEEQQEQEYLVQEKKESHLDQMEGDIAYTENAAPIIAEFIKVFVLNNSDTKSKKDYINNNNKDKIDNLFKEDFFTDFSKALEKEGYDSGVEFALDLKSIYVQVGSEENCTKITFSLKNSSVSHLITFINKFNEFNNTKWVLLHLKKMYYETLRDRLCVKRSDVNKKTCKSFSEAQQQATKNNLTDGLGKIRDKITSIQKEILILKNKILKNRLNSNNKRQGHELEDTYQQNKKIQQQQQQEDQQLKIED